LIHSECADRPNRNFTPSFELMITSFMTYKQLHLSSRRSEPLHDLSPLGT
jgi:hypothetical protein